MELELFTDLALTAEDGIDLLSCGSEVQLVASYPLTAAADALAHARRLAEVCGGVVGDPNLRNCAMKAAGLAVLDVDSCAHLVRILDGGLTRNMLWAGIVWAGSACEAASLAEHEAVAITNTGNWAIRVRPVCGDEGLHVAGGSGRCSAPELAQELGALFSEGRSVASALRAMLSQHEQWRAGELFELLRFGLGIPFHEACMVFRWDGVGSEGVDDGQLDAVLNGHMANALGARSSDTGDSH